MKTFRLTNQDPQWSPVIVTCVLFFSPTIWMAIQGQWLHAGLLALFVSAPIWGLWIWWIHALPMTISVVDDGRFVFSYLVRRPVEVDPDFIVEISYSSSFPGRLVVSTLSRDIEIWDETGEFESVLDIITQSNSGVRINEAT